ncbi:hypothetical protein [Candidatus Poriferisodalis sp.]|uniref:hypothetical protein n=1 Tax=Candidatus Poriferisodalis sp. TaxID=3101277 RepID=UPI003B02EB2B
MTVTAASVREGDGAAVFTLSASPPRSTTAAAAISDDDGNVPGLPPIAPCDGVVLRSSAADVFDIAQPGHEGDSHAFVLVDDVARLSTSHDPAEHALIHDRHSARLDIRGLDIRDRVAV